MNNLQIERSPEIIAFEINSIKEQTMRMVLSGSLEIGKRLIEAKSLMNHGEWGAWLKEKVDYSKSTANNLMKLFEEYGDNQLSLFGAEAKSQTLGNLTYTQAIALLTLPADEREEFAEQNNIQELSTRELQRVIKDKKKMEEKLKEKEAREAALSKEKDEALKEKEAAEKRAEDLREKLEKAKKEKAAEKELKELSKKYDDICKQKEESEQRIYDLEKKLREQPIEVATEIVEVIPEDVKQELDRYKRESNQSKAAAKFSVMFDQIITDFNQIMKIVNEMEGEEKEKYTRAVNSLIQTIESKVMNLK